MKGKHRARACGEVVLGESQDKGTPFIELNFRISEGQPHAGTEVQWRGYLSETKRTPTSRSVAERTIDSLVTCGWRGEDLSEFLDGELHGLDTTEVEIDVELNEFTGRDGTARSTPRVAWVNALGSRRAAQMPATAAQSLAERLRGLAVKAQQNAPEAFNYGANSAPMAHQPAAQPRPNPAPAGNPRRSF